MKKLVVLMIVFLALGTMLYAENATVALTGGVEAGAQIVNTGGTTTIQQYTNNEGTTGWANMNLQATMGDLSANFYLRSTDFTTWTIPNAWVTELLMNKMVELRAGVIDNGATGTQNQGWGGLSGTGIQVVVNPISGLVIGALAPAPLAATDLSTALQDFRVGAQYTVADMAIVDMTYVGGTSSEFDAGVSYTGMKNLTAQVEANILLGSATAKTQSIFENVSYAMGDLTAGINSTQVLGGATTSITVTPNVSYTVMPTMVAYGQVAYTTDTKVVAPRVGVKFPWNGMGTLDLRYDGSFGGTGGTSTTDRKSVV